MDFLCIKDQIIYLKNKLKQILLQYYQLGTLYNYSSIIGNFNIICSRKQANNEEILNGIT